MHSKTILITGANGFIGYGAVLYFAQLPSFKVIAALRKMPPNLSFPANVKVIEGLDIRQEKGWAQALLSVDCVLHCAARYHIPKNPFLNTLKICRQINVEGSLLVARNAILAKVQRFIFISSIKVHGEKNLADIPFREDDKLRPLYAYGISKMEAEKELKKICEISSMELVIIRPPPVYGDRVPANFLLMLKCINWGLPLPIKRAINLRSYVAMDNLLALVYIVASHPKAAGEIFLVGDDRDWSLVDLINILSLAMKKTVFLFSVSPTLLKLGGMFFGKKPDVNLLFLPSVVDTTKARERIGWIPTIKSENALQNTARSFLKSITQNKIN